MVALAEHAVVVVARTVQEESALVASVTFVPAADGAMDETCRTV